MSSWPQIRPIPRDRGGSAEFTQELRSSAEFPFVSRATHPLEFDVDGTELVEGDDTFALATAAVRGRAMDAADVVRRPVVRYRL